MQPVTSYTLSPSPSPTHLRRQPLCVVQRPLAVSTNDWTMNTTTHYSPVLHGSHTNCITCYCWFSGRFDSPLRTHNVSVFPQSNYRWWQNQAHWLAAQQGIAGLSEMQLRHCHSLQRADRAGGQRMAILDAAPIGTQWRPLEQQVFFAKSKLPLNKRMQEMSV